MEEILIRKIQWSTPEYNHKKRTADWFWTIGLVAVIGAGIAIWLHNYVFAIFILVSGACLILFTLREPQDINFSIQTEGFYISKEEHEWKEVKGFHIKAPKKGSPYSKLLILTSKKFLPIYTIPFPTDLTTDIREALDQVSENIELEESQSMVFMEKLGF